MTLQPKQFGSPDRPGPFDTGVDKWGPPKKNSVQIRQTPSGDWSVRVRHGWEKVDSEAMAHRIWHASWYPENYA